MPRSCVEHTSDRRRQPYVSATTLDAKLTELLHFMPCSAGRELCGQRKRTFKSCPLVSRHGISVHIVSFTGLWNLFTTSTHHQRPLGRASLPQDATPNTSNPHSCHAISLRNVVFDNTTLFTLSSRGVPHLIEVVGSWGLASGAASHLVRSSLPLVKKGH